MDSTTNSGTSRRTLLKTLGTGLLTAGTVVGSASAAVGNTATPTADVGGTFARSNYYRGYYGRRFAPYRNAFRLRVNDYCGTGATFDFDSLDAWNAGDTEVEFVGPYGYARFEQDPYGGFEFESPSVYIDCDYSGLDVQLLDGGPCAVAHFDIDEAAGELDIRYVDGGFIKVDSVDGYYGRRYWY
ncbi:hypothetical protein [Haloarchaeobius sp. TZWSO28]|uniref:hypothetical protein n=1 Tax=unclassified Haloarchaeobius TaxID=2614452 RepID=UPI003EBE2E9B